MIFNKTVSRRYLLQSAVGVGAAGMRSFAQARRSFEGGAAGEERDVHGVRLCWCPEGSFVMGSPPDEPERRPGEDQVEVRITKGFWTAKYEATQGLWRRISG